MDTGSILARISAAIDRHEAVAEAASGGHPHWHQGHMEWDHDANEERLVLRLDSAAVTNDAGRTVCYDEGLPPPIGTHIALQDPAQVARAAAAHRRILARHAPLPYGMGEPPGRPGEYDEIGPVCDRCGSPGEHGVIWPCDDVRDLAAVYGVEV